jgi:hypothetical protein
VIGLINERTGIAGSIRTEQVLQQHRAGAIAASPPIRSGASASPTSPSAPRSPGVRAARDDDDLVKTRIFRA